MAEVETKGQVEAEVAAKDAEGKEDESSESEGGEEESEPDYQALLKAEQEKTAKLTNDINSQRGAGRKASERDAILQGVLDEQKATRAVLGQLVRSQGDDDLTTEVGKIEAGAAQSSSQARLSAQLQGVLQELQDACKDADGNIVLDLETAPELEGVRNTVRKSYKEADVGALFMGLADALAETNREVRKVERAQAKEALAAQKKAAKEEKAQVKEEAGLTDTDLGGAAPSSLGAGRTSLEKIAAGWNARKEKEGT
ncbi:hypothetical protein CMI37_20360 [Candidatus Pacearchaeota archaeon]|nr:hypothetical protein [Candidatus Pacearchaeota archaeon]